MDTAMKGITATSADGMTLAATVDGNAVIMVTMTTDSPMAAPRQRLDAREGSSKRRTLNARPVRVTSTPRGNPTPNDARSWQRRTRSLAAMFRHLSRKAISASKRVQTGYLGA
jgi:hypothetical protein